MQNLRCCSQASSLTLLILSDYAIALAKGILYLTRRFRSLTDVIKKLTNEYLNIPYVETKCGYACSDQCVVHDLT